MGCMDDNCFCFLLYCIQLKDRALQCENYINRLVRNSQSRAALLYRVVVKGQLSYVRQLVSEAYTADSDPYTGPHQVQCGF